MMIASHHKIRDRHQQSGYAENPKVYDVTCMYELKVEGDGGPYVYGRAHAATQWLLSVSVSSLTRGTSAAAAGPPFLPQSPNKISTVTAVPCHQHQPTATLASLPPCARTHAIAYPIQRRPA